MKIFDSNMTMKVTGSLIFVSVDVTGVGCQTQGHWDYIYPEMLDVTLNDGAKIQPLLSSSTECPPIYMSSLTCHAMTVPFSHLAPVQPVKQWHRKSPFLSSQRTVPLALQGEGEHWSGISTSERKANTDRYRGRKSYYCFKIESAKRMHTVSVTVYWHQTEEGHLLCSAYQEFNINSLMLAKPSCRRCPNSVLPSIPVLHLTKNKIKLKFNLSVLVFLCVCLFCYSYIFTCALSFTLSLCKRAHV